MTNLDLRASLTQLLDAPNPEVFRELLAQHAAEFTSPEAEAELALWLDEEPANPDTSARLNDLRALLASLRAAWDPSAEEQLFAAFSNTSNSEEMAALVQRLNERTLDALTYLAEDRMAGAEIREAQSMRERLACLREIRAERAMSPLELGVQSFLRAGNEEQARAVLLAQPDLLLSPEAGEDLQGYTGANPESQAHIDARRALWRTTQSEHQTTPE